MEDNYKLALAELAAERELYNRAEDLTSAAASRFKSQFVLIKDPQYNTALPNKLPDGTPIPFAPMRWDKTAKRQDGTWDIDHVIRSTRFECPHCGGHIRDEHRLWLDKHGQWIPTRVGEPGHAGFQLSSYYQPLVTDDYGQVNFDSTWGGMANKFLTCADNGTIGGWINSDLAEVNASQQHASVTLTSGDNFATEDWTPLMDCDFQKNFPYIWFVVAKWSSFKLQPPFPITNGKPNFAEHLAQRPVLKTQCEKIIGQCEAAWFPLAEVLRFDPRTGEFPMLDYLISQNITGETLVSLWRERCGMDTLTLGRHLYREMGRRMPKGGDAEIIAAGHCELSGDDAWTELRDLQQQYKIGETLKKFGIHPNRALLIDSGYAEKGNPEVLRKCYESGIETATRCPNCKPHLEIYQPCCFEWYDPQHKKFSPYKLHNFMRPVPKHCWIPYRGMPTDRPRKDGTGIDAYKKWIPGDPFSGLREAEKKTIRVLEAASEHYFRRWMEKRGRQKEIQAAATAGRSYRGNIWNLASNCTFHGSLCRKHEDLERQLNVKGINQEGEIWQRANPKQNPDHLNDCAGHMMEAHAETLGFFSYERATPAGNNSSTTTK